jgi:hypothetical protein
MSVSDGGGMQDKGRQGSRAIAIQFSQRNRTKTIETRMHGGQLEARLVPSAES